MIIIKTFLIVDGHSLAHRGYHAVNAKLSASDGTPTAMIVGFMNMLFRVQDDLMPDCTVIVFDAPVKKSFRYELQEDYKAFRKPLEDDLRIQLPILQELLRLMGYRVIIREGVEADDVAASIAKLAKNSGHKAVILTSDKDLLQMLDENIRMMRPVKHGISEAEMYDVSKFHDEFGFMPSSMADYLALVGDKSDNIKGVKGIGEVGAKKLLADYPTIESLFASLSELSKSTRTKLEASDSERVIWTRDNMIRLKDDLFDSDSGFLNDCENCRPDIPRLEELAVSLGLRRLLERIGSKKQVLSGMPGLAVGDSVMPDADILTDDYKASLKENPGMFPHGARVWDLRTAYYLLHPDEAAGKLPDILSCIRQRKDKAEVLAKIAGGLEARIESHEGLKNVMNEIDIPLVPVLLEMEEHGVRVLPGQFEAVQSELEARILEIDSAVIHETGVRINMNSSQQVSWLLFDRLGFTPLTKTKSKASYSTDSSVLERLAKLPEGTIPRLLLEYRELTKMLSGFVIPLQRSADGDGIIHTTFEPAVTGTGRLSSRDPNLQNIPAYGKWAEGIKKGLVPVENGNVFVAADYSQIELRVLAYLSGEERLLEAFRKNRDIHTETASWVFGVLPELVSPELRRTAKMINFGLLYGMSEFGLAERLDISRKESKEIMQKYFAALPGIQSFLEGVVDDAKTRGCARTLAGRIRPVNEIPAKGQALDRALINMPVQGTAADIARGAMINFAAKYPGRLFLQVHDSLVCECRESEAEELSDSLREIMRASGGEIKYLEVAVKQGKSLADV
ncbi:MAG: DNA polymerase I [Synergistaceae bacterium]|nr:DNA polymerase I [Synergistaceae bacterium]